jgi:hypothetical protein
MGLRADLLARIGRMKGQLTSVGQAISSAMGTVEQDLAFAIAQ